MVHMINMKVFPVILFMQKIEHFWTICFFRIPVTRVYLIFVHV